MRRRSCEMLTIAVLSLAIARCPARAGDSATGPARLAGADAWARVVGNTIRGVTPDGPYSQFFAPDGTLRSRDQDGTVGGHWSLEAGRICVTLPDEEQECRDVEAGERAGAFIDSDGTRYAFDILPGNPDGL